MEVFNFIILIFSGIVLGIATVVPGFSVGTMAVIINVYDRLIDVITPNIKKIAGAWKFWLPLVVGGIIGIVFFSKMIEMLLSNYNFQSYWFFIGVVLGSIPLIYKKAQKRTSLFMQLRYVVCVLLGLAVMVVMKILKPDGETEIYTELSPLVFGLFSLGGALAAIAMIIPGLSGTLLLLVIGLYPSLIQAVSSFSLMLLLPVAIGAIAGLLIGAAFVRFLLAKAPDETYGVVLGLIAGSVLVLYPGGLGDGDSVVMAVISVICMLAGCALSFFMGRAKK